MIEVITLGESMAAMRGHGPMRLGGQLSLSVAGAESNVAIGLSRLGHRTAWVGRVGADQPGELVTRTLRAEGVEVGGVVIDPEQPTGLILFEKRISDLIRVRYYRTDSAGSRLQPEDLSGVLSGGARLLHVTGITPALGPGPKSAVLAAVDHAKAQGWIVSLDVNHRSLLWSAEAAAETLGPLARRADVVIASPDELAIVEPEGYDDLARADRLLTAGVGEVVVKLGADGARVHHRAGVEQVEAVRVPVVDTVGAGDAFSAGYLSALLDGEPVSERLRRGSVLGAFAVASPGDWEGLPTREELPLLGLEPGTTLR
ncbi:sugar kinase [Actinoalloteichus hymeniacidonis]|uniref:Sugar kinase, ribokinase n=1 Tax=Actinoalloteichus hymeniacidonis TaxID=340345 RepID=A0AAC9HQ59_9PSEU|nr:sugar kinase [Actinoalloteichus hymeniacidonis]AOS63309.1 sugar kinase, ribokinase [Actinoalloteichus hymeniacidonis]MBB5908652.1 2-dehydro-3-deoxygluconokinase [Actinoalloteichus hymeniacidonis]